MRCTGPGGATPAVPRSRRITLVALCSAVLIAQLDTAVVNLALRPIGQYFDAGVGALQWVLDSYNLAYTALLLSGGLLADRCGRRRVFMAGAAVFTGASLLCASATSVPLLIAGRALAGLGAALLLPASLAIVRVVWREPHERARALGWWAGCNGLALAIGPIESNRTPAVACCALALAAVALALFVRVEAGKGGAALVPLTWQASGRLDATGAGLALMPMALVFVVVSSISGWLARGLGPRVVASAGVAVIGSALWLIGLTAQRASVVPAECALGLTGLGMGMATARRSASQCSGWSSRKPGRRGRTEGVDAARRHRSARLRGADEPAAQLVD